MASLTDNDKKPSLDLEGRELVETAGDIFAAFDKNQVNSGGAVSNPPNSPVMSAEDMAKPIDQRYENSVLFSLANLQALAFSSTTAKNTPGAARGNAAKETSGLIEIRLISSALTSPRTNDRGEVISVPTTYPYRLPPPARGMSFGAKLGIIAGAVGLTAALAVVVVVTLIDQGRNDAVSEKLALLQNEIARLEQKRLSAASSLPALKQVTTTEQQAAAAKQNEMIEKAVAQEKAAPSTEVSGGEKTMPANDARIQEAPRVVPTSAEINSRSQKSRGASRTKRSGQSAGQPDSKASLVAELSPETAPSPAATPAAPSAKPDPSAVQSALDNISAQVDAPSPQAAAAAPEVASPAPAPAVSNNRTPDELDNLLGGSLATPVKPKPRANAAAPSAAAPSAAPPNAVPQNVAPQNVAPQNAVPPMAANAAMSGGSTFGQKPFLNRQDVQRGMASVANRVRSCGNNMRGTVTVHVVIGSEGNVLNAVTTGPFAGTPVGMCAAQAVSQAQFPKSSNNLTVSYPFQL